MGEVSYNMALEDAHTGRSRTAPFIHSGPPMSGTSILIHCEVTPLPPQIHLSPEENHPHFQTRDKNIIQ